MLDLEYFRQRFKSEETAQAAFESYLVGGEGRTVAEAQQQRLIHFWFGQKTEESKHRAAFREFKRARAAQLRDEGFTYASIARILHISKPERISAMVRNYRRGRG